AAHRRADRQLLDTADGDLHRAGGGGFEAQGPALESTGEGNHAARTLTAVVEGARSHPAWELVADGGARAVRLEGAGGGVAARARRLRRRHLAVSVLEGAAREEDNLEVQIVERGGA